MDWSSVLSDFHAHAARYVARHAGELVSAPTSTAGSVRDFLPLDVGGALIPCALPSAESVRASDGWLSLSSLSDLASQASLPHGALTVRADKGLLTRGVRLFYVNGFHADSELRARAPDEDYESAPSGTLRGPFVVSSARSGRTLVGDFVRARDGGVFLAYDELALEQQQEQQQQQQLSAVPDGVVISDSAPAAGSSSSFVRSRFDGDALARMGSAFDWLPFMSESGIPKVFWLLNVNAASAQYGAVALMGMDHDDGKCSLHTAGAYTSLSALADEMRAYIAQRRAISDSRKCLTFGEFAFYSRGWSLFYPSLSTPVIAVDCNTEALDWRASHVHVDLLPPNTDPFHRELIKASSRVNADLLAYEASIASTQARLASSSSAQELEDDDDMVRGGGAASASAFARAPQEIVNSWVSDDAVDAALRHDRLTQQQQPVKYGVREISDRNTAASSHEAVLYSDVLRVLPRMIDAFDAFAATHADWSDVQIRERIIDMNSDFAHFANGRFTLVQHLLKRERADNLLQMTLSVAEACSALQEGFERKTLGLDLDDPEERDEYDAARADFEREIDREIQTGWAQHGFEDAVWLNQEMLRDLQAERSA